MGVKFFRTVDGIAINAVNIDSLQREGFDAVGNVKGVPRKFGEFNSAIEAQAYVDAICEDVSVYNAGENAKAQAIRDIYDYMLKNFIVAYESDNFSMNDLMVQVCVDKYDKVMCGKALKSLILSGHIYNPTVDVYFIPTLPTDKALQRMISTFFNRKKKGYTTEGSHIFYELRASWRKPNYPDGWAEDVFVWLKDAQYIKLNEDYNPEAEGIEYYEVINIPDGIDWNDDGQIVECNVSVFKQYFNHLREGKSNE